MPTFNGEAIFGVAVKMATASNPRADQKNAFAGLNGVESLDQGDRGTVTTVSGHLIGIGPAGLNAALMLFRSYRDGRAYALVDNFGNTWPFVKLASFEPTGKVNRQTDGYCSQAYTATFEHLITYSF